MGQDIELFSVVTKFGLNYDQVIAWSDPLEVEIEPVF